MESLPMFYLIIVVLTTVRTQSYDDIDALHEHLFNSSRYNKHIRPLRNQSHIMQVYIRNISGNSVYYDHASDVIGGWVNLTQFLTSIDSFDISSGELQVYGYFELAWIDEFLTWDPSLYGGKKVMPLQMEKVWKPKIPLMVTSDTGNDGSLISESEFASAWVDYQGFVVVVPAGSYKTRCDVDTTLFPFDRHKCFFQFYVSNHGLSELVLYSPSDAFGTSYFTENSEWILEDETSEVKKVTEENIDRFSFSMMETSFVLRRREAFYLINTFSPALFMGFLNTLTCFIRPDSGERLSFAVTLYLALTFSSTESIEHIPNNSLKMPFYSYALLLGNILNTLSVCWSIFIVRLASSHRNVCSVFPKLVRYIAQSNRRQNKCLVNNTAASESFDESIKENCEQIVEEERDINAENVFEGDNTKTDKESENNITGLELAIALDKIYFSVILAILVLLGMTFFSLMQVYRGK